MSRCGSCPIYTRSEFGVYCEGDHGVEDCADKLHSLYYAMAAEIRKAQAEPTTIEKTLQRLEPRAKDIHTLLGCCELLAGMAEEAAKPIPAPAVLRGQMAIGGLSPVSTSEASHRLNEEFADVVLCAAVLGLDREEVERFIREKAARWFMRLEVDE